MAACASFHGQIGRQNLVAFGRQGIGGKRVHAGERGEARGRRKYIEPDHGVTPQRGYDAPNIGSSWDRKAMHDAVNSGGSAGSAGIPVAAAGSMCR